MTLGEGSPCTRAAIVKAARRFKAQSHIWRIKCSNGRIEDWVRELVRRLITVHHLPGSHAPGAISDILRVAKAKAGDHDESKNDEANTYVFHKISHEQGRGEA